MRTTLLVLVVVAAGAAALLLWPRAVGERPTSGPERPAPPPSSPEPLRTALPTLVGRPMPPAAQGPSEAGRKRLVERTQAHEQALRRFEAGVVSRRDVLDAELAMLEARYDVGEIDGKTLHAERARIFGEAAELLARLFDAGFVPELDVARARLHVAYEEALAGGDASRYAADRAAFRERLLSTFDARIEAGLDSVTARDKELRAFEAAFPESVDKGSG